MLPGAVVLADKEKAVIDFSAADFDAQLESFYQFVIDDDVDAFALHPEYAQGFYALTGALKETPTKFAKGQVMGPMSFGLTFTDQDGRACLYNDVYVDVLVKHITLMPAGRSSSCKKSAKPARGTGRSSYSWTSLTWLPLARRKSI